MDERVEEAVDEILRGSNGSRIKEVKNLLNEAGVSTADDLKYFDWKSLEELKVFSSMEVNKIMRFVQKNFPEEYREHKKKRTEETALKRETELLNFKTEMEILLQKEMLNLEKDEDAWEFVDMEDLALCSADSWSSFVNGSSIIWKFIVNWFLPIFSSSETIQDPEKCIDKAIAEILEDSSRIEFVTEVLKREGVQLADDLKYFNEKMLKSIGAFEETEIKKIMSYIQGKYPEIYEQHKQEKTENYLLQELLKCKAEAYILKQPSFIAKHFTSGVKEN